MKDILIRTFMAAAAAGVVLCDGKSGLPPAAWAIDTSVSRDQPDLASARARIKSQDYRAAITELTAMLSGTPNADIYNLLGFSYRKLGDYPQALTFYREALAFDPVHRGALEYLGELYVETNQIDKAREHASTLRKLCPQGCEELTDLEDAIAKAPATTR